MPAGEEESHGIQLQTPNANRRADRDDRDVLMIDNGQEVTIMKVIFKDLQTTVNKIIKGCFKKSKY